MPIPSLMLLAPLLHAQQPAPPVREIRLGAPVTTLAHDFTQIRGLRELPDGRLFITDRLEPAVDVVDLGAGRGMRIGREGSGPEEYRMPGALGSGGGGQDLRRLRYDGPDHLPRAPPDGRRLVAVGRGGLLSRGGERRRPRDPGALQLPR